MSKNIKLSKGLNTIVDDDDYEMLSQFSWYAHDGGKNTYAATRILGDIIYMHQMILSSDKTDEYPFVDHINNNTLDNRKENLRPSNSRENSSNRSKTERETSSKFKGVTRINNNKWKAHIGINDKDFHIGYFKTENDAAKAYNREAKEIFGDKAKLNEL
jgi:hypothetical protein